MRRPSADDVRIEIRHEDDGWWGLIFVHPDHLDEVPLLVGPCEDEESAQKRAHTLALDVLSADDW